MTSNIPTFTLKDDYVEMEHGYTLNRRVLGRTITTLSYYDFLSMLQAQVSETSSEYHPVRLYMHIMEQFEVNELRFPKHTVKVEYIKNVGLKIYQLYGGDDYVFRDIRADKSKILVSFILTFNKVIPLNSIKVARYNGVFAGVVLDHFVTELPVLTSIFKSILREDVTVSRIYLADFHSLIKKLPRSGIPRDIRTIINQAKNTDTIIQWEEL